MLKRGKASCMADCVVRIFIAICALVKPAFHNRLSCATRFAVQNRGWSCSGLLTELILDVFALNPQAAVIPCNLKWKREEQYRHARVLPRVIVCGSACEVWAVSLKPIGRFGPYGCAVSPFPHLWAGRVVPIRAAARSGLLLIRHKLPCYRRN